MPQIGPMEMLVVAVVALIVFGPQRLPEIARTIGRTLNEFRRQAQSIRTEFESGLDEMDPMKDDDDTGPADAPTDAEDGRPMATRLDEGQQVADEQVADEPEDLAEPSVLADELPPSDEEAEDK
jgi:Tat protein translocase TatB subunit